MAYRMFDLSSDITRWRDCDKNAAILSLILKASILGPEMPREEIVCESDVVDTNETWILGVLVW